MIETELLRSFAAFGATRNFTRAAKHVGVSQPAFFERIQKLSEALGLPLYERQGRELVLTPSGDRVLAFARETEARFDGFVSELHGAPVSSKVTLAAGEGSYLYFLGPALARFAKESTSELSLLTLGAKATVAALLRGDAQLGVAVLDLVPRTIDAEDLVSTPLCVAMHAGHPLARRRRVKLADFRADRLILSPEGQLHRDLVSRALVRGGDAPSSVLEADGWPLMLKFVQMGLGIAVVNGICELPKGVVVKPAPELGKVTYRLLSRRGALLPPDVQGLMVRIRELRKL